MDHVTFPAETTLGNQATKAANSRRRPSGFTMLDMLIVATVVSIIITYALTEIVHAQTSALRHKAAQEFSNYLRRARDDSMRRHATDTRQMARLTIVNNRSYSVALDANGDGVIDSPVLINLAEQGVSLGDATPRTFMFDSNGRTVDSYLNVTHERSVCVVNNSGKSVIEVSETAQ